MTRVIIAAALSMLASSCSDALDGSTLDIDRLCSLSASAHTRQDFNDLLQELARQVKVDQKKMRVTKEGVFVPMQQRFVEESGYFVARPGIDMKEKGTDPSFDLIKACVYRYRIKG